MATIQLLSLAVIATLATIASSNNITSPPITNWGVWGSMQRCPWSRNAQGFQLKTEPNQYLGDDTALNAIRLFCGDPFRPDTGVITSTQGDFGSWGNVYTCYPGYITGFQLRVESDRGSGDDTATNNIRFWCSNDANNYIQGDGMSWGDWSEAQHCYGGKAVCGIQTQVEPYQGGGVTEDDTMLNNVRFECCDYLRVKPANTDADLQNYTTVADLKISPDRIVSSKFARKLKSAAEKH